MLDCQGTLWYMGSMNLDFVLYRKVDRIHHYQQVSVGWGELDKIFFPHRVLDNKFDAPLFGPYTLKAPDKVCYRHGVTTPHRCNACVDKITMAVFDADRGSEKDMISCDASLEGIARLWYSSYSYNKDKPAFRLVIPIKGGIEAGYWKSLRSMLIEKHRIPADSVACSGISHSYFLPACPPPGTNSVVFWGQGEALEPHSWPLVPDRSGKGFFDVEGVELDLEEGEGPVDLTKVREDVLKAVKFYRRKDPEKAKLLELLLEGLPLSSPGTRDSILLRVCGMVTSWTPGAKLRELKMLMAPSIRAMEAMAPWPNRGDLDRMLITGMERRAEKDAQDRALDTFLSIAKEKLRG